MTRQERRQRLHRLAKVVERIEQHGLPTSPALVDLSAIVATIDKIMDSHPVAGRSARLVNHIARLQDKSNANAPFRKDVACRQGCTLCCSLYVSASALQIFAICDFIRTNAKDLTAEIERIEAADVLTRGLDGYGRFVKKAFCAFLIDGNCSIYTARPSGCRGVLSRSVSSCESAYRGDTVQSDTIEEAKVINSAFNEALWTILYKKGFKLESYELAHAVLVALKTENPEERWYGGEDIFSGVATDPLAKVGELDELFWNSLWNVAHGETVPPGCYAERFPDWCR